MIRQHNARAYRLKRKRRVRARINGTPVRQRLSIFRSGKHIYAQIIDDTEGHTLAAASSLEADMRAAALPAPAEGEDAQGRKVRIAASVGRLIGERAVKAGIAKVAFDRSGFIYHGRVKALADGARAAGLDF